MPDILIRGMEMPIEQPVTLVLDPSGRVWLPDIKPSKEYMAKELPPHGDLIDRDALGEFPFNMSFCDGYEADEWVQNAPVIIPATEEADST